MFGLMSYIIKIRLLIKINLIDFLFFTNLSLMLNMNCHIFIIILLISLHDRSVVCTIIFQTYFIILF